MFIEYDGKVPRISETAFVAPTAMLIGDVEVGDRASIWFGVVLRADNGTIRIGARSAIEDNAVVHAREGRITTVGDDATVGHCAVLDDCTIGKGALVGSNATDSRRCADRRGQRGRGGKRRHRRCARTGRRRRRRCAGARAQDARGPFRRLDRSQRRGDGPARCAATGATGSATRTRTTW